MMRQLRKGVSYRWHAWAMAPLSISTAKPSGKCFLMPANSARSVMKRSPLHNNPPAKRHIAPHGQGGFVKPAVGGITGGKPLHLSPPVSLPAPHVVVDDLFRHHDIHHPQAVVYAARHAGVEDAIGSVTGNHFDGPHGTAHFPDARFHQYDLPLPDAPPHEMQMADMLFFRMGQQGFHQPEFRIHGNDDSYHISRFYKKDYGFFLPRWRSWVHARI